MTAAVETRIQPQGVASATAIDYGTDGKARGAIFTRSAVVDFMLDLVGYTSDRHLSEFRILEPSFGGGRFVLHAVDRLVQS